MSMSLVVRFEEIKLQRGAEYICTQTRKPCICVSLCKWHLHTPSSLNPPEADATAPLSMLCSVTDTNGPETPAADRTVCPNLPPQTQAMARKWQSDAKTMVG